MLIESPVQCFMNGHQGNFVGKCALAIVTHFGKEQSAWAKRGQGPVTGYVAWVHDQPTLQVTQTQIPGGDTPPPPKLSHTHIIA